MGNLDSLPVEIILEILKRVDIDSVIQCRLVSRSWNYLVYHHLLDYLKETQMEFQRQAKEIDLKWGLSGRVDEIKPQVDPMLCTMSICFTKLEVIMELIKEIIEFFNQDGMDALKNSGGTNALFVKNVLNVWIFLIVWKLLIVLTKGYGYVKGQNTYSRSYSNRRVLI
ncbi:hypothetical protein MKX03_012934 [Papaver bracteatum]|nr:hypothetical protein MKX03_012934 [Papaver bracteatum]